TYVGDAFEAGEVDAEHVTLLWRAVHAGPSPMVNKVRFREECCRPRRPGVGNTGLPIGPAHKCGTPRVAFSKSAVAEVSRHPRAVVSASGFAYTDFGGVDFA